MGDERQWLITDDNQWSVVGKIIEAIDVNLVTIG